MVLAIILSGCKTAPDTSAARTSNSTVDMSLKVQALQKEIRERDKRIEELESQLNTLKLIEQDFEKQRVPIRPPATLRPID
jgi:predicted RNase H-like nuclease (RuvC/YqgF family)